MCYFCVLINMSLFSLTWGTSGCPFTICVDEGELLQMT
jgi:hypothetical protein